MESNYELKVDPEKSIKMSDKDIFVRDKQDELMRAWPYILETHADKALCWNTTQSMALNMWEAKQ